MVSALQKVLIILMLALLLIQFLLILNESQYGLISYTIRSSLIHHLHQENGTNKSRCPEIPPNLHGRLKIRNESITWDSLEKQLATLDLQIGGSSRPKSCGALYGETAIIVPYRNREDNLLKLLLNLHPLLVRQQLDYTVFVVEQEAGYPFNRASLMNVGFAEALKRRDFDCFIFHDVDLIPEDDRNLYRCENTPRHMSVAVDKWNYSLPYENIFGGVSAFSKEMFERVNGFSNEFWGRGCEDDDMAQRVFAAGLNISRYPSEIARYTMLKHRLSRDNPQQFEKVRSGPKRFKTDGLVNLQYTVLNYEQFKLYTWILVRLNTEGVSKWTEEFLT